MKYITSDLLKNGLSFFFIFLAIQLIIAFYNVDSETVISKISAAALSTLIYIAILAWVHSVDAKSGKQEP